MTDIGVYTVPLSPEDLSWDLSQNGVPHVEGGTIDLALFTAAQHFPNGFLPSGTVLAKKTSTGLLGPYLDSLSNGQETAVGVLRASVQVLNHNGTVKPKLGVALLTAWGVISQARLPFTSSNAAAGGFLDAAAKADLAHLHFVA